MGESRHRDARLPAFGRGRQAERLGVCGIDTAGRAGRPDGAGSRVAEDAAGGRAHPASAAAVPGAAVGPAAGRRMMRRFDVACLAAISAPLVVGSALLFLVVAGERLGATPFAGL